ncbi:unnamed protein product [Microthlaspi erraticum]|uniref:RNase H type-1 domain-containing protein n=1 Tax=Microthlaspi erraticum TaxID=1685480 RepID=A0A6D2I187_9BRAS|nr:unnamed protein product [Microthlaspi erraticum]
MAIGAAKRHEDPNQSTHTKPTTQQPKQNHLFDHLVGSWCKKTKTGGMGWILLDGAGSEVSRGHATERRITSALMAEALAIRSALNHALELGITDLQINSDALDLIRVISTQEQLKEIYEILFDIHALASMFSSISFSYIPRSENKIADEIAKSANRLISIIGLVFENEIVTG